MPAIVHQVGHRLRHGLRVSLDIAVGLIYNKAFRFPSLAHPPGREHGFVIFSDLDSLDHRPANDLFQLVDARPVLGGLLVVTTVISVAVENQMIRRTF